MIFIEWKNIEHNGRKRALCPICSDTRKNKKDRCLSINHDKGTAYCHHCEAVSFREDIKEETEKHFKLPVQTWRNYTKLSDDLVKWLERRGLKQSTAIELGWTEERYYQPALNKEMNNLVFNSFEGDVLVNKKYRTGNKCFTQSAGTKSIFYNINSAIGKQKVYIVEGEFDCAVLHQEGVKEVISVPNGANDNDDYWVQSEAYLKGIKEFIIAVDNDEKGIKLREDISHRLGKHKCSYVEWIGKDANDDLLSGHLKESLNNIKRFPVSGTFTMSDLLPDVLDLYDNGLPKTIYPKDDCFGGLKDIFSVMLGQLTVVSGIRSHGKSTFTDWYVLNLVKDYDMKASWFSPEHNPLSLYNIGFIQKTTGKNFWGKYNQQKVDRVTKEEIEEYKNWSKNKIYFTDPKRGEIPTWDWLIDKFKEQIYSFGIKIFVIDAFNKVLLGNKSKKEEIDRVLTILTTFCQQYQVLIFLVAHPTKIGLMENGLKRIPNLTDVSGSGDFENQTHNGFVIYRYWEDLDTSQDDETLFISSKVKYSFQGVMSESISFKYNGVNDRYYANGIEPNYSFFNEEIPIETIKEYEDEIPF